MILPWITLVIGLLAGALFGSERVRYWRDRAAFLETDRDNLYRAFEQVSHPTFLARPHSARRLAGDQR